MSAGLVHGDTHGAGDERSSRALSFSEYRALAEFRCLIRAFLSFSERAARDLGIEPQQHQLLLACKGLPLGMRPTVGTLGKRLCVEHNTAVALVDKLQASQLVERAPNPADRREVLVTITEHGESLLRSLSRLHREQLSLIGPALLDALSDVLSNPDS